MATSPMSTTLVSHVAMEVNVMRMLMRMAFVTTLTLEWVLSMLAASAEATAAIAPGQTSL